MITSSNCLAHAEFIIEILNYRTSNVSNYADLEEFTQTNLRILFIFLDFGKNRKIRSPWRLLYRALSHLPPSLKSFVIGLWHERSDWWPKFHSIDVEKKTAKYRNKVFCILKSLTV